MEMALWSLVALTGGFIVSGNVKDDSYNRKGRARDEELLRIYADEDAEWEVKTE